MAINTSTISEALDASLNSVYQDGVRGWPEEYSKVANVLNSDKQTERDTFFSGFGLMPEKDEGVSATYDVIQPGANTEYTHVTYALGYEITEEAMEDNQHSTDTFNKLPQALSASGMESAETVFFNIFNNGFTTNGYDGVTLFSTAHVNTDGSTWANRPTTDADLSVTSLQAALTTIEKYENERGLKRPTKPTLLLVPPDLEFIAEELLNSEWKPYTGNNESNALLKKDLRYMVGHYLTDTDAWFLLADKPDHDIKFFWRRKPGALRRGNDFDSTNLKHLATMRFSAGYSHARGTYGTQGA